MNRVRPGAGMIVAVGLSFCLGLLVFYVPERKYSSVPEVWLPTANGGDREKTLALPVKTAPDWQLGVRFLPLNPGEPEIVELDAAKYDYKASSCPDVFAVKEESPSACKKIGTAGGNKVYGITRQKASLNVNAYTFKGGTLLAITGVHSNQEAVSYFRTFAKIARRDVTRHLSGNRIRAEAVVATIKREKQQALTGRDSAHEHLPFVPALPATLPAGWAQYATRIGGESPQQPTSVQVFFKKGRDNFISMTLLPKATFTLGTRCGPTPGADNEYLACSQVKDKDYFTGGTNDPGQVSLYIYRPIGDIVAVLQTSVYSDNGQQLLFSDQVLLAQKSIAASLRSVDKSRLEGAEFIGTTYDSYPDIRP